MVCYLVQTLLSYFTPLVNEPVNSYFISTLQGAYDPTTIIRRLELIVHIAISVLPGTIWLLSEMKYIGVNFLSQGHSIKPMTQR